MGNAFAGDKLKKLRQNMSWSQVDLADRIGVSGSMVSMYESGQREPARDTLIKIANEFKVPMDELLSQSVVETHVENQNPLRDREVDFGFTISRSNKNPNGGTVSLLFSGKKPVLKVGGDSNDFAVLYSRLLPEDKIAVCREMLRRAKDELMRG